MKRRICIVLLAGILLASCLGGCGLVVPPAAATAVPTAELVSPPTPEPTAAPTPEPTAAPTPEPTPEPTPAIEKADAITIPAELDPDGLVPIMNDLTVAMVEESGKYTQIPMDENGYVYYYQAANLLGKDGMTMIVFDGEGTPLSVTYVVYESPDANNYGPQVDYFQKLRTKIGDLCGAPISSVLTAADGTETMNYTTQSISEAIANKDAAQFTDSWTKKAGVNIIIDLTLNGAEITYSLIYATDAFYNEMLNEVLQETI